VHLHPDRVTVVRQLGRREDELRSARFRFRRGEWHDMSVEATGGRIKILVNRQAVLDVLDPLPLPGGVVAFGCSGPGQGPAYETPVLKVQPSPLPARGPSGPVIKQGKLPDLVASNLKVVGGPTQQFPFSFVPPGLIKGSYWYVRVQFQVANVGNAAVASPHCEVWGQYRNLKGNMHRAGFFQYSVSQLVAGGAGVGFGANGLPPGSALVLVEPLRPGDVANCEGWLAVHGASPDRLRLWVVVDPNNLVQEISKTNNVSNQVWVSIP